VEFLEYERPAAGRPMPADTRPTDLWHWHTTVVVSDVDVAAAGLRSKTGFVSSGAVMVPGHALGFVKALLVQDPDGHVVQLIAK
jgi:hypothetical protein